MDNLYKNIDLFNLKGVDISFERGCIVITLMNHKGGSGKTAGAINLAKALQYVLSKKFGREGKVLLGDFDPQANITNYLLGGREDLKFHNSKVDIDNNSSLLFDKDMKVNPKDLIVSHNGMDIIPARKNDLFNVESALQKVLLNISQREKDIKLLKNEQAKLKEKIVGKCSQDELLEQYEEIDKITTKINDSISEDVYQYGNSERTLRKNIEPLKEHYDVMIFDLSPSINIIPRSVWVASDSLMLPISDKGSIDGVDGLLDSVIDIVSKFNSNLKFIYYLNKFQTIRNKYGEHLSTQSYYNYETIREKIDSDEFLKDKCLLAEQKIRLAKEVEYANIQNTTLIEEYPDKLVTKDFIGLAEEIIYLFFSKK